MRREGLDEVAHEAAQEGAAAETDLGHAGLEQLAGIQGHQVVVVLVHRHVRHDAHAQPEAHVGLDHVGIGGGEHHLRRQAAPIEGLVQLGAAGEAEHIGDDRVLGQRLQGQLGQRGQGMSLGHDHAAVPAVAGHHDQIAVHLQAFGGDGEIHRAVGGHLGNLRGRALMHVQRHVRVALDEAVDDRRQRVARLGVGGGDGQVALLLVGEFLGDLLDAFHLAQDLAGGLDDVFPRRGDAREVFAAAGEDLDAQLVLQQANLLADARLGGIEALSRRRDVQIVMRHFPDVAQLLKLHVRSSFDSVAALLITIWRVYEQR